jgi:hypothetical protein
MMDHVESHLRKELGRGLIVTCRHPVYEATGLVLETVDEFKLHVKEKHGIILRNPWYMRQVRGG